MSTRSRWFAVLAVLALAGWLIFRPSKLASQYMAPLLTCACGNTMVLSFEDGRVTLYNTGHRTLYDLGTYECAEGKYQWRITPGGPPATLRPHWFGVDVVDETTGIPVEFPRSFRVPSYEIVPGEEGLKATPEYLGDMKWLAAVQARPR